MLFSEWRRHFIDIEPDFMLMFERFEMLGALTYLEASDKNRIRQALANQERSRLWMPVGRVGWDSQNGRRLVDELQEGPLHDVVLAAGFARKDPELLDLFIKYFKVIASKMHW